MSFFSKSTHDIDFFKLAYVFIDGNFIPDDFTGAETYNQQNSRKHSQDDKKTYRARWKRHK